MRSEKLFSTALIALLLAVAIGCQDDSGLPTDAAHEAAIAAVAAPAFVQFDRGGGHICGVTSGGQAYCWGSNDQGQLGNGSTVSSAAPVAVAGELRFRHVTLGRDHTCGVTTDDRAYCWGFNWDGQLGDGTMYPENVKRLSPVPVAGGRRFRQIRAGDQFTCALTPFDAAFCWGYNVFGQLGDGTREKQASPVRVRGGLAWRQLNAGESHVCGVTTDDLAYCWGMNFWGQLGNGSQMVPRGPVPVAGGLRFRQVSAGGGHSCGVTTANRAYCWGNAQDGQLGDGTAYPPVLSTWTPVAVATTLRFDHVMAGTSHTCGITLKLRAFCWGSNSSGEIGNGTKIRQLTPVAVSGGFQFEQVVAGAFKTAARTPAGVIYIWGNANATTPVPALGQ